MSLDVVCLFGIYFTPTRYSTRQISRLNLIVCYLQSFAPADINYLKKKGALPMDSSLEHQHNSLPSHHRTVCISGQSGGYKQFCGTQHCATTEELSNKIAYVLCHRHVLSCICMFGHQKVCVTWCFLHLRTHGQRWNHDACDPICCETFAILAVFSAYEKDRQHSTRCASFPNPVQLVLHFERSILIAAVSNLQRGCSIVDVELIFYGP